MQIVDNLCELVGLALAMASTALLSTPNSVQSAAELFNTFSSFCIFAQSKLFIVINIYTKQNFTLLYIT